MRRLNMLSSNTWRLIAKPARRLIETDAPVCLAVRFSILHPPGPDADTPISCANLRALR